MYIRTTLVVQQLGLCNSTAGHTNLIPVRELGSCMLYSTTKKKLSEDHEQLQNSNLKCLFF